MSKSRPAVMSMSSCLVATSSSAASSPIASKSLGMSIASGKPDSKMNVEPSSFDAASTSQVRLNDAYFGCLMEGQRGPVASRRRKFRRLKTILKLEPGTTKRNLLSKTIKLGETTCTRSPFFSSPGISKEYGSDMGPLSPHIARHIALHGSRLHNGQEDLWKTTRRSHGRFECEFGYLVNTTFRAAVHLGKDYDTNMRFVKNYLWKTTGQLFRDTEMLISGQTETTGIILINFQDRGGYRQAYRTAELVNMPLPRSLRDAGREDCLGSEQDHPEFPVQKEG